MSCIKLIRRELIHREAQERNNIQKASTLIKNLQPTKKFPIKIKDSAFQNYTKISSAMATDSFSKHRKTCSLTNGFSTEGERRNSIFYRTFNPNKKTENSCANSKEISFFRKKYHLAYLKDILSQNDSLSFLSTGYINCSAADSSQVKKKQNQAYSGQSQFLQNRSQKISTGGDDINLKKSEAKSKQIQDEIEEGIKMDKYYRKLESYATRCSTSKNLPRSINQNSATTPNGEIFNPFTGCTSYEAGRSLKKTVNRRKSTIVNLQGENYLTKLRDKFRQKREAIKNPDLITQLLYKYKNNRMKLIDQSRFEEHHLTLHLDQLLQKSHAESHAHANEEYRNRENALDQFFPSWEVQEKEALLKKRIIENFIQGKRCKPATHSNMRKIFVILDGTIVLNPEIIHGHFLDIPSNRALQKHDIKKREEFKKSFLSICTKTFQHTRPLRAIANSECEPVADLIEVSDSCEYIFVSPTLTFFQGISLVYSRNKYSFLKSLNIALLTKENMNILNNRIQGVNSSESGDRSCSYSRMETRREVLRKKMLEKCTVKNKDDFTQQFSKYKKRAKLVMKKKNKYLFPCSSFSVNEHDNDEWIFLSTIVDLNHHEDTRKKTLMYSSFYEIFLNFHRKSLCNQIKNLKTKLSQGNINDIYNKNEYQNYRIDQRKLLNRFVSNEWSKKMSKSSSGLLNKHRREIIVKHKNIPIKNNLHSQQEKNKFLSCIDIVQVQKSSSENSLNNFYLKYKSHPPLKFVIENKKAIENPYITYDKEANKYYPSLLFFNLPKLLQSYSFFSRAELYELFTQYKALLILCMALNKNSSYASNGIDFRTFSNGVPEMRGENKGLAQKIFNMINRDGSGLLSFEEFLQGMSIIRSSEVKDKIDMFFRMIDIDGNGKLSYDEVYEISQMSLQRGLVVETKESQDVIKELSQYFSTFLFKLVALEKDQEVPLSLIREKILNGGHDADYFEVFCCVDKNNG